MPEPQERREIKTTTKDGVPLAIGNIPVQEKMYFYERTNGTVFNVGEEDAVRIHTKFKFLGMSDGKQYTEALRSIQARFQELTMKEIQEGMREAWRVELETARGNLVAPVLKRLNLNMPDQIDLRVKDTMT